MNLELIKGYVLVIVSGLVLLAAGLLIILQWGNFTDVTMYGPVVKVNTGLLMIASAVGGIAIGFLVRAMVYGLLAMHKGRRVSDLKRAQSRIAELDKRASNLSKQE